MKRKAAVLILVLNLFLLSVSPAALSSSSNEGPSCCKVTTITLVLGLLGGVPTTVLAPIKVPPAQEALREAQELNTSCFQNISWIEGNSSALDDKIEMNEKILEGSPCAESLFLTFNETFSIKILSLLENTGNSESPLLPWNCSSYSLPRELKRVVYGVAYFDFNDNVLRWGNNTSTAKESMSCGDYTSVEFALAKPENYEYLRQEYKTAPEGWNKETYYTGKIPFTCVVNGETIYSNSKNDMSADPEAQTGFYADWLLNKDLKEGLLKCSEAVWKLSPEFYAELGQNASRDTIAFQEEQLKLSEEKTRLQNKVYPEVSHNITRAKENLSYAKTISYSPLVLCALLPGAYLLFEFVIRPSSCAKSCVKSCKESRERLRKKQEEKRQTIERQRAEAAYTASIQTAIPVFDIATETAKQEKGN